MLGVEELRANLKAAAMSAIDTTDVSNPDTRASRDLAIGKQLTAGEGGDKKLAEYLLERFDRLEAAVTTTHNLSPLPDKSVSCEMLLGLRLGFVSRLMWIRT